MREPEHAAAIVAAMTKAVRIPVTVKMRAGWNEREINAPELAKRMEGAGASAVAVHGRTAAQAYRGRADWELVARIAASVGIPVFGSGDLIEAAEIVERLQGSPVAGVLVGRGILRNPWLFAQAEDLLAGRPARPIPPAERGRFLLEYIDLLLDERVDEAEGFRHSAPHAEAHTGAATSRDEGGVHRPARGRERWVINKLRALCAYYTKGFEGGSHLRVSVNSAESIPELKALIRSFFGWPGDPEPVP